MPLFCFRRRRSALSGFGAALLALPIIALATDAVDVSVETSQTIRAGQIVLPDFAALVGQYGPAVVNITVSEGVKTANQERSPPRSFRGPGMGPGSATSPFQQTPRGSQQTVYGEGSGFIVAADGVVLTNAHVVADAKEVIVKLTDHREFTAKVIGLDEASDVAVLKIAAKGLPTVRLGDSSKVAVGEWVVAIGAPFGLENSVTQGIVSAKGRVLPDGSYVPFLQTDVAINPGNSGGPLFNLAGEVIGINSQIYSRSGGYQGISFAIPIDVAMNVSQQLQASGHVTRGKLGVTVQPVDGMLARSFGLTKPEGALIAKVDRGSSGDLAGLKAGDVILRFNGHSVVESSALPSEVAALAPGQKVVIEIWREHQISRLTAQLGELSARLPVTPSPDGAEAARLGLALRPLSAAEQQQTETTGLMVEAVHEAAAAAGIAAGDIVISANGALLTSIQQLVMLSNNAQAPLALLIQRDGQRLFIPVELG